MDVFQMTVNNICIDGWDAIEAKLASIGLLPVGKDTDRVPTVSDPEGLTMQPYC